VRPLVVGLLIVVAIAFMRSTELEPQGQADGEKIWNERFQAEDPPADSLNWYKHVKERLDHIDTEHGTGPYVFISASGGGSRAAMFTSLVLQGLAHEDFPEFRKGTKGKWADRIVLIS